MSADSAKPSQDSWQTESLSEMKWPRKERRIKRETLTIGRGILKSFQAPPCPISEETVHKQRNTQTFKVQMKTVFREKRNCLFLNLVS